MFGEHGILEALAPGAIHLSMRTISTALAERLERAHREKRQELVCAPVFGRPEAAAKLFRRSRQTGSGRNLRAGVRRARPEALYRRGAGTDGEPRQDHRQFPHRFGDRGLKRGNCARKAGIDRACFVDILTNTLFGAPAYKTYGALIAEERFSPAGFKAELGYKDVRLALSAAQELKVPMPLASLISDRFLALIASGGAALDWSALALVAKRDAGDETAFDSPGK